MKYGIGLDCGIASVGFSVMELDQNDEPKRIIRLGSRIFEKAENPKDGSSLALPRREARGTRRRIRRHQHRLDRIKYLIVSEGILSETELATLFDGKLSDIYELRTIALDELVDNKEFSRILINLAQRRGFKSNRKVDSSDKTKDDGKLLSAVNENKKLLVEKGYRTVGEMFFRDERYSAFKRNKGEDYLNTVSRDMVAYEIKAVFEAQRRLGSKYASEELEQKYTEIVLSQRPFDIGPGAGPENSPSHYSGEQIEKMIGKCTFFPEEKRAAKATYSFQLFTLLQAINNITLVSDSGEKLGLSADEKKTIKDFCFKTKNVTFASIRKKLSIPVEYKFNSLSYGNKEMDEIEKKAKFDYLKYYHEIKKVLGDVIFSLSIDELDAIGEIFTKYKNDAKIIEALKEADIDENLFDLLLNLPSFKKFGHISVKACKMIIPFLEEGLIYNEACEKAGIDFKAHGGEKDFLLPSKSDKLDDITNPVVRRAVSQTIKVINAIIREQGCSPTYINIELARELSKSKKERDEIDKQYQKNRQFNEKIRKEIYENFGIVYPTGLDIVKLKLWHEQDGICPYSLKQIEYERLFEDGYVDIDHIIPYSICFDDSYNNKVLTFSSENRQKRNRIPMEYISEDKRSDFQVWVNSQIKNYRKRQNLLKKRISKEDIDGFKSRSLNDTKYLSRVLFNYIKDSLLFADFADASRKNHVMAVNGATTAYMRKRWGISKIREDGDLHHALDATVIACVTNSMVQRISAYSRFKEIQYSDYTDEGSFVVDENGEVLDKFPFPYPSFRKELEARTETETKERLIEKLALLPNYSVEDIKATEPCFVSRMPNHKTTGPAHQDTIRSGKQDGYTISKVALAKLKLDKDGEIKNYYDAKSDRLLYEALKKRLVEFGGDGEKAFPIGFEFYKPKSDGTDGPVVKKVKLIEKASLTVPSRNEGKGVAANGSMVRVDVFYVENEGYYFVPIYVADTVKPELPNKACVQGKKYEEWKEMDDKDFIFSLYPNDLIKIKSKKQMKFSVNLKDSTLPKEKYADEIFVYYKSANIHTSSWLIMVNDASYKYEGLGIKTLLNIEKYVIDPIGNVHKIGKEKRMSFR